MPLDHFVEEPVTRMRVVDDADSLLERAQHDRGIVAQKQAERARMPAPPPPRQRQARGVRQVQPSSHDRHDGGNCLVGQHKGRCNQT